MTHPLQIVTSEISELEVLRAQVSSLKQELEATQSVLKAKKSRVMSETVETIARVIDTESDPQILSAALQGLQSALGIERAAVLAIDSDTILRFKAWVGLSYTYRQTSESEPEWVSKLPNTKPLIISDVKQTPFLRPLHSALERENIRALAFTPLVYHSRQLGWFMLCSKTPYDFKNEIEFTLALGKLVAFGLFRSDQKYQQLVESIDGVVWESTPDFRFTFVSKQVEKILGYTPEQWIADPKFWANHIHPDDRDRAVEFCKEQRSRMNDHEFEYRFIAADGRVVYLRDLVHVEVENGEVRALKGIMLDITEKVRTLNELKELSEHLSTLMTSISDFIWSATIDTSNHVTYRYFSPVIEKITGRPAEFFMAGLEKWVEVIHPDDRERASALFKKILNREVNYKQAEYRIVLPDGQIRWIRDSSVIHALPDGTRRIDGVTGDITALKLFEESREHLLAQETKARIEAEKAVQLRDDFLSIATHELKTPLTPIRVNLQMMRRHIDGLPVDLPKVDFLRKAARSTEREFERFLKLVEKLLDVSRISAGRLVLDRNDFDLSLLLQQVVKRFSSELKKCGCELHLHTSGAVRGYWDGSRLEQVIVNLLSNAMKYGAGKPIDITLSKTSNHALLRFTDHGIGISKEDQEKVFHRFERVAPIRNFGGFGLGLFIAQELVAAHGGRILLESEPGKGSTFTVELPLI